MAGSTAVVEEKVGGVRFCILKAAPKSSLSNWTWSVGERMRHLEMTPRLLPFELPPAKMERLGVSLFCFIGWGGRGSGDQDTAS